MKYISYQYNWNKYNIIEFGSQEEFSLFLLMKTRDDLDLVIYINMLDVKEKFYPNYTSLIYSLAFQNDLV